MMLPTTDALEHALHALVHGASDDPFAVLGPHVTDAGETSTLVIRTIQPAAERVEVVRLGADGSRTLTEMRRLPQAIVFAAEFPGEERVFDYRLRITEHEGFVREIADPWRYGQVMGELDLHLFGEGNHYRAFERLGSHPLTIGETAGTVLRRLGSKRRSRQRGRRLQSLERPGPSDAAARAQRDLGAVHPRPGRGRALQVPDPSALRRPADAQGRSLRASVRDAAGHGVDHARRRHLSLA